MQTILNAIQEIEDSFDRAQLLLLTISPTVDALKEARPDWREQDADVSLLIRRVERLRGKADTTAEWLDARAVAARLPNGLKSDGKTPQDSTYTLLRKIGSKETGRWLVRTDDLDAHLRRNGGK